MKLILTILSLLLFMVAISGAADNPKTTLAPNTKDTPTKTAPAKEIATAKSVDGKEDETKNVKKGDLSKDSKKNESSEESPSEDAQEDLGIDENQGPIIPAYQIPEQPKDVKRKKRWDNSIGYAIDNALGAIFGRPPPPPPADTVIEEITYVDEYPPGPVVYKRSKGLPPPSKSEADNNDTKLNPTKELADTPIDSADTVSLKGESIAISKPEVEAKTPIVSIKNAEQKAMPKMEVGNEVTILPAIDEEKDFGSSAENVEEMKYQRIAPEVAGLIKKSVPLTDNSTEEESEGKSSENENEEAPKAKSADKNKDETIPEDKSSSNGKEELQEKQMKEKSDANEKNDDKKGEKEFAPVYPEEDKESEAEEAAEKPQKDDPKALKMGKTEESESQKGESVVAEDSEEKDSGGEELSNKSEDDKTSKESKDEASKTDDEKDKAAEKDETAEEKPEKLPINPKTSDEKDEDKAAEKLPLVDHEPKKQLPEEEKDDASEKSEEDETDDKVEKNNDDEGANIEKDEYAPVDGKVKEDKVKIDAINPVSPEIKESKEAAKKPVKVEKDDDKLGPAAYPSEISDDDFSIDHKTGLMPAVSSSSNDNDDSNSNIPEASENEKGDDYNVLQKLQDDVDAAAKKDQSPDYIVMEELKDPIQGHRKFTILKPTYRAFHPTDNKLIEEVKATLDKSKIEKRSIKSAEENESEEESFGSSFSKDTVIENESNEILKNVADAIERDGLRKPKKDQQPMFIPDDYPIPLKKIENPTLNQILGIPESAGPIMIEPEGGIPKGLKQVHSDSDESEFINPDYDAPQKVVIESKQKITLVYDDSSEEATKDSSSESLEEEQQQKWIPIMDIATIINDQTSQKSKPIVSKVEDPEQQQPPTALPMKNSEAYEEQLKKYSNILGNNLVITLSISPPILIIAGVICLTLLLFKVYWILYSPPLKGSIIPQHSSSSSSAAAATTPNMDFRTPLSIVTVNDDPKKLPL